MEYIWKDYYDCIIDEDIFLDKEAKELTGIDGNIKYYSDGKGLI